MIATLIAKVAMASSRLVCEDDSVGPTIHGCRGDFDFTLLFEQSFLSIAPSALLIFFSLGRVWRLKFRSRKVAGIPLQLAKMTIILCYGAIQTALLILWGTAAKSVTRVTLAAAALSLSATLSLAVTSWLEHARSPRPSSLITVYLLLSSVFDAVQTRTIWLVDSNISLAAILTTSLAIKICLLVLESVEKGKYLTSKWRERSPEETSGILNQSLLLWLRRILSQGSKQIIAMKDLYVLDKGLKSSPLSEVFWKEWSADPTTRTARSVLPVLLKSLKWQFLAPVLPRLAQTGFTICQPFLLVKLLGYLQAKPSTAAEAQGYGLIGAYGLVYFGIAISTCFYWRLTHRCLVQIRGCLVAAIYKKTMEIDSARYNMAAPVSLMGTDIERIIQGLKDFHELWANTIQVALSIWLLYREMGAACVAPAVVAAICSLGALAMSASAARFQVTWMAATQERVEATASAISSMKGVKLLGLTQRVGHMIEKLRAKELQSARMFRYVEVLSATVSFAPLLLSPIFTLLIFVLRSKDFDQVLSTTRIFVTLALLQLMTQPLVWLFQAIPLFIASIGCLSRIGDYLLAQPRIDGRQHENYDMSNYIKSRDKSENDTVESQRNLTNQEKQGISGIVVRNGDFGWTDTGPVLKNVDADMPAAKLTIIIGPVASGKTTLGKGIIGELPFVKGEVLLRSPRSAIAYCSQDPFLINGTLQYNILGFSAYDRNWYDLVIDATGLRDDIARLPQRDRTNCGSKGIALSGGQRHRLAIARAVYSKAPIVVFDDVLSGLDAVTKDHVFEHVFSSRGLLRQNKCTVVFCTHDLDLLPQADHIIVLGPDSGVIDSGTPNQMMQLPRYMSSLSGRAKLDSSGRDQANELMGISSESPFQDADQGVLAISEDQNRRLGDVKVYKYFLRHIGLWRLLLFIHYQSGWATFSTIGPVWLKVWSTAIAAGSGKNGMHLGVYAVFQSLALVYLALFAGHTLTTMAVKAGVEFHSVMLKTTMAAPMSFFSTVDTGTTINRFSQDIMLVDGELPMALLETVSAGLVALVQMVLIAVASPYVAISYPFIMGILYLVQKYYLRTSRQLRFLDLEAKSPLYTHFLETLHGLATIRAFGWSGASIEKSISLLDQSQRPLYLLYMVQRWLQLVLDLLTMVVAVVLVATATNLRSTSSSFIGVALINLMSINQELKMIVVNWTNLETSLGAVARIKSFQESIPTEHRTSELENPPSGWPYAGNIELRSVTGAYGLATCCFNLFRLD